MIVDAFLANDELDLVLCRLEYLSEVVDVFMLGQAKYTFSGRPKPLAFRREDLIQAAGKARVEIVEIPIPEHLVAESDPWKIEAFSRDYLYEKASIMAKDGVALCSDADEVPSIEQVRRARKLLKNFDVVSLPMRTYFRKVNLRVAPRGLLMLKPKAIRGGTNVSGLRNRLALPVIATSGVHISYLGMKGDKLARKYSAFSHSEFDNPFASSQQLIDLADSFQINHAGSSRKPGGGLLIFERPDSMTAFQENLLSRFPDSVASEKVRRSKITRMAVARRLTIALKLADSEEAATYLWKAQSSVEPSPSEIVATIAEATLRRTGIFHFRRFTKKREASIRRKARFVIFVILTGTLFSRRLWQLRDQSQSQLFQDLFALKVGGFKHGGFFVEFGATNGMSLSNTYLLERRFNWNGILAEPGRAWHAELYRNRKVAISTRAVWKVSGQTLEFAEVKDLELSTLSDFVGSDGHAESRRHSKSYPVETISLEDLLAETGAPEIIDYISIDTEGSEFEILSEFDFSKYKFRAISIEHNFTPQREAIHRLLLANGYRRVLQLISRWDDWYVPRELSR